MASYLLREATDGRALLDHRGVRRCSWVTQRHPLFVTFVTLLHLVEFRVWDERK